ncbi:MAG: riboflavin synthase [Thermodesulfobacteriota bacterium]
MFTGIIQTMGRIQRIEGSGGERRLYISPEEQFSGLDKGESVSVNGVCLTVEEFSSDWLRFYVSAQTISQTSLQDYQAGHLVNLERALAVGERMGGHFVNGHVDCVATVRDVRGSGESNVYGLQFEQMWSRFIVPKGSVALDGISLTVIDCGAGSLEVNVIPETGKSTNVAYWKQGTKVNLEVDIIAKYVQHMLSPLGQGKIGADAGKSRMSYEFLQEYGFGSKLF